MKTRKIHDSEVKEILKRFDQVQEKSSLNHKKTSSNTLRNLNYRSIRKELGVDRLDEIVEVNLENHTILVEPSCPMDKLVTELTKFNLMVPIVPEFKGITVGGAINGTAIESSSFFHGQFNDICIEFEIIIGNGELIIANRKAHEDLFFAMAGAYGSLGIITLVKLQVIPLKPFVAIVYHRFKDIENGVECLKNLIASKNPPQFVEGIIYNQNEIVIIEGNLKEKQELHLSSHKISTSRFKPFFYNHVKETPFTQEYMDLTDYFFRHDRGAFWMGSYAANIKLLFRYLLENQCCLKKLKHLIFKPLKTNKNSKLMPQNFLFRIFFGSWMTSRTLYSLLHMNSENWFKENFVIQDYFLPVKNTMQFINIVIKETNIFPIWLCPVLLTNEPQIFSAHYKQEITNDQHFIDIGLYGMPNNLKSLENINRAIEHEVFKLNGRKMLYSFNYYTKEEFYKIYSLNDYQRLKEKYHAKELFSDIFDKL